jgi:hypothetical protein
LPLYSQSWKQSFCETVKIDPDFAPKPMVKSGYTILFHDECESIDSNIWSLATPGDGIAEPVACFNQYSAIPHFYNVGAASGKINFNILF